MAEQVVLKDHDAHRLPTKSAAEALQRLTTTCARPLTTGLDTIDSSLSPGLRLNLPATPVAQNEALVPGSVLDHSFGRPANCGLNRGQLFEIYGPPGVGKTMLAMQVAANVLASKHEHVVWIDTSFPIVVKRLADLVAGCDKDSKDRNDTISSPEDDAVNGGVENFKHYHVPSLAHLFAWIMSSQQTIPEKTSLIVIDAISHLPMLAFPRGDNSHPSASNIFSGAHGHRGLRNSGQSASSTDPGAWASGRRWVVMADLLDRLGRLAAENNAAIVLISQIVTKLELDSDRAVLKSASAGRAWTSALSGRIELSYGWVTETSPESREDSIITDTYSGRFAQVINPNGLDSAKVAFFINKHGLTEKANGNAHLTQFTASEKTELDDRKLEQMSQKRKLDEVADSEDDFDGSDPGLEA